MTSSPEGLRPDRVTRSLLAIGLVAVTILLLRFSVDFSAGIILNTAFRALVALTLALAAIQTAAVWRTKETIPAESSPARKALVLLIPAAFVAASLDCTGLSPRGCSSWCTFVKSALIPLIALLAFAYAARQSVRLLSLILAISLATLVPHCACYNMANAWWIDRLGASPVCYAWGVAVSIVASAAMCTGRFIRSSIILCSAITAGSLAFFVGHHYLAFPW